MARAPVAGVIDGRGGESTAKLKRRQWRHVGGLLDMQHRGLYIIYSMRYYDLLYDIVFVGSGGLQGGVECARCSVVAHRALGMMAMLQ